MAGLINRRGRWYARISLWDGLKNKEKQIPLITKDYSTALIRKKEIEKVEINFKLGNNYKFPWLVNSACNTRIRFKDLSYYIREYKNSIRFKSLSISTQSSYTYALRYFISSLGKIMLNEISLKSIDKYKVWLYHNRRIKSPVSINIHLKSVRSFLYWCHDREYINRIPKIELEKVNNHVIKYITELEFEKIMNYPYDDLRFPQMFQLYWETGLRLEEGFYGTVVNDIEGNQWLDIELEYNKSKRFKSIEINKLQAQTVAKIQAIWIENGKTKDHIKYYSKMFKKVIRNLKIDDSKKFHSLRHSFGMRRIIELKGNITKLRDEMGHSSVKVTEIYSKGITPKRLLVDFPSLKKYL